MNYTPLSDHIIIKTFESDIVRQSGLIIPDTAKDKPQFATVIRVGPGTYGKDGNRIPIGVKEGDVIAFGRWAGTPFVFNEVEYLIIRQEDIFAVQDKS